MSKHYETLGVPPTATADEIKKAWRKKCSELHPDRNTDRDTTSEQQAVNAAYECLSDPVARSAYDSGGEHVNIPAAARNRVTMTFESYLRGGGAESGNLIALFDRRIAEAMHTLKATKAEAEREIKRVRRQRDRLKGPDTLFADLADQLLGQLEQRIKDVEIEIAINTEVSRQVHEYTDTPPKNETVWGAGEYAQARIAAALAADDSRRFGSFSNTDF